MRPTPEEILQGLLIIRDFVREGFPETAFGQALASKAVYQYLTSHDQLMWLVEAACTRMRRFNLGELRGIFCTRFRPFDGIEARPIDTPGYSTGELEYLYIEAENLEQARKKQVWALEAAMLGEEADPDPLALLPEPKKVPNELPLETRLDKERQRVTLAEAERRLQETMNATARRAEEEQQQLLEDLQKRLRSEAKS